MAYETIEVRPLAGALGAEIAGVDLKRALGDNRAWSEIHRAFLDHLVIVFRGQALSPDDLMAVGRRFGEPSHYPFVKGMDDHPFIFEIVKAAHETKNFGGAWHSDTTYLPRPPLATLLYALETPEHGGDTLFANQYLAYETLSAGMRGLVDRLAGVNSAGLKNTGGRANRHDDIAGMKIHNTANAEAYEAVHPAARTHPETGRKALYVNRSHTIRFEDMTEAESQPLIDWLALHAVRPDHTCRLSWAPGTLAIWDNRCTQHYAINDYHGQRRVMQRLTVGPEMPR
ncbi:MAG: TauD/TfdA family dioxygenase [Alphaproteobacteria bacterium]|nr:TauD/TfdA family dioxygenase [Alphaproteobacteria bacterium]